MLKQVDAAIIVESQALYAVDTSKVLSSLLLSQHLQQLHPPLMFASARKSSTCLLIAAVVFSAKESSQLIFSVGLNAAGCSAVDDMSGITCET